MSTPTRTNFGVSRRGSPIAPPVRAAALDPPFLHRARIAARTRAKFGCGDATRRGREARRLRRRVRRRTSSAARSIRSPETARAEPGGLGIAGPRSDGRSTATVAPGLAHVGRVGPEGRPPRRHDAKSAPNLSAKRARSGRFRARRSTDLAGPGIEGSAPPGRRSRARTPRMSIGGRRESPPHPTSSGSRRRSMREPEPTLRARRAHVGSDQAADSLPGRAKRAVGGGVGARRAPRSTAASRFPPGRCATERRPSARAAARDGRVRGPARSPGEARKPDSSKRAGPVGAAGFEPATSCSQSRRATGLRHAPSPSRVPRKNRKNRRFRRWLQPSARRAREAGASHEKARGTSKLSSGGFPEA